MKGTRENYRRKMRLTYYRSSKKCTAKKGASKRWVYFEEFSKKEKLTWVEITFDDVKGGGEKNGISPSIPTKPSAAGVTDNV